MPKVDMQRRRFIGHSITGGLVAALVPSQPVGAQATAAECGFISKSDWLVNGLGLVSEVSSDAYRKIVRLVSSQLTSYKAAFDELYCLLNALNAELAKSPATAQATIGRIKTLAHVARTNGDLVSVAVREGEDAAPLFLSLALISQEVCSQAVGIPAAEREWTLSKEAAGILKKILELIGSQKFITLHQGVVETQDASKSQSDRVNTLLSTLQISITAARTAILLVENPHPTDKDGNSLVVNKAEQMTEYDKQLASALVALKSLTIDEGVDSSLPEWFRTELPKAVMSEEQVKQAVTEGVNAATNVGFTAADSLILGLGTCRRQQHSDSASQGEVRFMKASFAVAPPPVDRTAIGNLLWRHCPPGSRDQIDKVDSVVAFVGGWSLWIPEAVRMVLIASALYWANKGHRITCSGSKDLRMLAEGLSKLR